MNKTLFTFLLLSSLSSQLFCAESDDKLLEVQFNAESDDELLEVEFNAESDDKLLEVKFNKDTPEDKDPKDLERLSASFSSLSTGRRSAVSTTFNKEETERSKTNHPALLVSKSRFSSLGSKRNNDDGYLSSSPAKSPLRPASVTTVFFTKKIFSSRSLSSLEPCQESTCESPVALCNSADSKKAHSPAKKRNTAHFINDEE